MLLENGSTGPYVKCLEYDLHILNCYTGEFDGEFGSGVEAAVKQFQGRAGLSQDGIVGDGTWGAIVSKMEMVQNALNAHGASLSVDGEGGPDTLQAVENFQSSHGLGADGYVGPDTQAALGISLYGGSSSSGTASGNDNFPLQVGSAGPYVKCLEYSLHIANCYTGEFDGEFGPGVKAAVEQFQTRAGIGVDGIVGPQTWSTLKGVISNIQNALNSHGASLSVDGEGGPSTLQAVENFQSSHGLGADGYVGPQTASVLGIQYYGTSGGSSSGGGSIPSGYSAIVKYVQKVLNMIYGEGLSEDGFEGTNTTNAIKAFQKLKGLNEDGVVGPSTMTALSEAQAASFGCNGGTVSDFVNLAEKQAEIGFLEKGGSAAGTGDNDTTYGMWYGENFEPWCAMFVSWCANFSGFSEVPRYAYCPYGVDYYQNEGRFHYAGGYTPQYGDVVFYEDQGAGESTHTGIVIGYNAGANTITTVEGNAADNVAYWTRSLDQGAHLRVLGFGDNNGGSAPNSGSGSLVQSAIEKVNTSALVKALDIELNGLGEIVICDNEIFKLSVQLQNENDIVKNGKTIQFINGKFMGIEDELSNLITGEIDVQGNISEIFEVFEFGNNEFEIVAAQNPMTESVSMTIESQSYYVQTENTEASFNLLVTLEVNMKNLENKCSGIIKEIENLFGEVQSDILSAVNELENTVNNHKLGAALIVLAAVAIGAVVVFGSGILAAISAAIAAFAVAIIGCVDIVASSSIFMRSLLGNL